MKFFIEIDRETIKPNPRANQTQSIVQNRNKSFRVKCKLNGTLWIYSDHIIQSVLHLGLGRHSEYELGFSNHDIDEVVKTLKERKCYDITVEVDLGMSTVNHFPIEPFTFKYKKKNVQCAACDAIFDHSKLQSDSYGDGSYSDTICPKCGEINCCRVEYERLKNVETKVYD